MRPFHLIVGQAGWRFESRRDDGVLPETRGAAGAVGLLLGSRVLATEPASGTNSRPACRTRGNLQMVGVFGHQIEAHAAVFAELLGRTHNARAAGAVVAYRHRNHVIVQEKLNLVVAAVSIVVGVANHIGAHLTEDQLKLVYIVRSHTVVLQKQPGRAA